ncbi:unnamed protein product [Periconia digitata]|uniref:Uncharacterized protein n=1 Tax=Periconia digitata TaxID=1303443 RepID=A0A9W4UBM4_9PLEO|nr:unnamed protein product [Periconia digitata]
MQYIAVQTFIYTSGRPSKAAKLINENPGRGPVVARLQAYFAGLCSFHKRCLGSSLPGFLLWIITHI